MKISFSEFVKDFNSRVEINLDHLKKLVRSAIDYYELKSIEKLEETANGKVETLYIASMAEENILSRIVGIATGEDISIEEVYDGYIVRKH
ncbi:DUF6407 family protein [Cytobacillus sp. FJAT-54145]|uniref:DUF6407 family protein n=1 Tax=Cytobacillus spartinae TaxID=3299023 RepID=A0ABW6K9M5_9BACI